MQKNSKLESAIKWWNETPENFKSVIISLNSEVIAGGESRHFSTLTGREIMKLYETLLLNCVELVDTIENLDIMLKNIESEYDYSNDTVSYTDMPYSYIGLCNGRYVKCRFVRKYNNSKHYEIGLFMSYDRLSESKSFDNLKDAIIWAINSIYEKTFKK